MAIIFDVPFSVLTHLVDLEAQSGSWYNSARPIFSLYPEPGAGRPRKELADDLVGHLGLLLARCPESN